MQHKVSIIIPVYNAEKTLQRCVDSIVYGDFRDVEVILVDDCSTDRSWDLCREIAAAHENVICAKNLINKGVSFTRNHGLDLASSEYIMFVDSDDWVSGRYVQIMLKTANANPDSLVICGLSFQNELEWSTQRFIWELGGLPEYSIGRDSFFDLLDRFHIQSANTKIFKHEIIKNQRIRFDETQSMGEDFQFVLDYIQASGIKKCHVLNKALYYYVRSSDSTLMSHFGLVNRKREFARLEQLYQLCGQETPQLQRRLSESREALKKNHVYQVLHSRLPKAEKIVQIEDIMQDGCASTYYREQRKTVIKENICRQLKTIKRVPNRAWGRIMCIWRTWYIRRQKKKLKTQSVSLISQNCIAGVFYHDMGLQFQSPTINLFFPEPDFIRFVTNIDYYLSLPIQMNWDETYPIGCLEDVRIHFMHYSTCREAHDAWERRKARIAPDRIVIVCTDMEGFGDSEYACWQEIQFPKVLFSATERDSPDVVSFPEYATFGEVANLIPRREFYKNDVLMKTINSLNP